MRRLRLIAGLLAGALVVAAAVVAVLLLRQMEQEGGFLATRFLLSGLEQDIARQDIEETEIEIDLRGGVNDLRGTARLRVLLDNGLDAVRLLLNPGLRITDARVCGQSVAVEQTQYLLRVPVPGNCSTGEAEIELSWEGAVADTPLCVVARSADETVLPALALWYPLDLHSFSTHHVRAQVPDGYVVAGASPVPGVAGEAEVFEWNADRPVWGATLAAGQYRSLHRTYVGVECGLYWPDSRTVNGDSLLQLLGNVLAFHSQAFGESGFQSVELVLTAAPVPAINGGNGVLIAPVETQAEDRERRLLHLAELTSHLWWGGTVGVRWFTQRPEAGRWMVESLPVYSSWQALEHFEGRRALLRTLELQHSAPTVDVPMNQRGLSEYLEGLPGGADTFRVRGPLIARMIAGMTGREAFETGCRNFFAVHRYRAASYAALRHELELAAERDLEEIFRVWLERGGTFDYSVDGFDAIGDDVVVTISNKGDIPALYPLEIAIVSGKTTQITELTAGAFTNTYTFPVHGEVTRVVLDPYFATADMSRADNIWPRRVWPAEVAASAKGSLAVSFREEWFAQPAGLGAWPSADSPGVAIALPGPLSAAPVWSPAGNALALPTQASAVWTLQGGLRLCREEGAVAGWRGEDLLVYSEGRLISTDPAAAPLPLPPLECAPVPGSLRFLEATGAAAWISSTTGTVEILRTGNDPVALATTPWQAAGDLAWSGDSAELLYLSTDGELRRGDPFAGEPPVVLKLDYPVRRSAISRQGRYIAWLDDGGSLRVAQEDRMYPRLIPVPGEIQSFSWEGDAAILCLATQSSRLLPMRFHSDWSLFRIPVTSWEAQELPIPLDVTPGSGSGAAPAG